MPLNKPNLFKNSGISEDEFLKNYWHKKPILIRNAINLNNLVVLPNKQQLLQLSCNEDIQSRIVFKNSENQYDVEYGPFIENDWKNIEQDCWNLLVSDIDKWQPKSCEILEYFKFIRHWIFDDIMLSCGSIGGTVGPHTDHYDVFLLQVHGKRKWGFTQNKIFNPELIPKQALKLMSDFQASETHILNPGDVLYLPPEVAHYGIATTDDCVTCSIGIRTPSHSELLTSFIDNKAENISANNRFQEPHFDLQPKQGEVTVSDLDNVTEILTRHMNIKNGLLNDWFGKYITEYRSLFYEFNQQQDYQQLSDKNDLILSSFSKSCYFKDKSEAKLFVNGEKYHSSLKLAEMICNHKCIANNEISTLSTNDRNIIKVLYENGSLITG